MSEECVLETEGLTKEFAGFVAVSGVEPIEQDFSYWSKRTGRPPLQPAPRMASGVLR